MAFPTPAVTTTTAATFIPEIWSDEIVAAYKKNLVLANIVKRMNLRARKVTPFTFLPRPVVRLLRNRLPPPLR